MTTERNGDVGIGMYLLVLSIIIVLVGISLSLADIHKDLIQLIEKLK